ncbi:MAG: hypothetical protein ACE5FJ_11775 [Gemmatimonadales bacterium]
MAQRRLMLQEMGDQELVKALDRGAAAGGFRSTMSAIAEVLAMRAQTAYVPAIDVVSFYDSAGEPGKALEWLQKAWENRDPDLPYIATFFGYSKEIKNSPHFQEMLERMNLPPHYAPE